MNQTRQSRRNAAFSLTEVAMATGIVAMLALPILGMLAGGGTTQGLARDRETSSRLAREIAASVTATEGGGGGFELSLPGGKGFPLPHPSGGAAAAVHAAFDAEGRFLESVSPGDFTTGVPVEKGAFHLARLELKNGPSGDDSLLELEISIQQPAAASEAARSKERFQTRLAAP